MTLRVILWKSTDTKLTWTHWMSSYKIWLRFILTFHSDSYLWDSKCSLIKTSKNCSHMFARITGGTLSASILYKNRINTTHWPDLIRLLIEFWRRILNLHIWRKPIMQVKLLIISLTISMWLLRQELSELVMDLMSFKELSFFHIVKTSASKKIHFLIFFWAIRVILGKPQHLSCSVWDTQ